MADPARNAGGSLGPLMKGLTPQTNWDSMFHNFLTGSNPLSTPPASNPGRVPATPGAADISDDEQFGGGTNPAAKPGGSPSIQSMASGGNHAAAWSQPSTARGTYNPLAGTGYQTGDPAAILNKYQTPGTTASYGWGEAFQNPNG